MSKIKFPDFKRIWPKILILISILFLLLLIKLFSLKYINTTYPLKMEQLYIDESMLPSSWQIAEGGTLPEDFSWGERENKIIFFNPEKGSMIEKDNAVIFNNHIYGEEIIRIYKDAFQAKFGGRNIFYNAERVSDWVTPEEVKHQKYFADKVEFKCANFNSYDFSKSETNPVITPQKQCSVAARYRNIIIELTKTKIESSDDLVIFSNLFKSLDQKVAKLVNKN